MLSDCHIDGVWTSGREIRCKSGSMADDIAKMLILLYDSQNEKVVIGVGFYNPKADAHSDINKIIKYPTGWWYVVKEEV